MFCWDHDPLKRLSLTSMSLGILADNSDASEWIISHLINVPCSVEWTQRVSTPNPSSGGNGRGKCCG